MEIIMKLPLYFYKFKKKMKILTLSLCISVSVFLGDAMPSYASSYEDLMEAMENRKSLPVQSNEIENWPDGPLIGAEAAIVVEANTGVILYSKNIHEKLYPASTTKILTCLIATENSSLDEIVSFSSNAVFSIEKGSSFPGNYGQVIGRGIMVVVMEAVGIGKMGVQAAKFRCFLVHHFREPFRTSPDMFRHCVGNFIGGANEDTIKAFFHSDRLPHIHSHIGTAFFNGKNCVAGKRDRLSVPWGCYAFLCFQL